MQVGVIDAIQLGQRSALGHRVQHGVQQALGNRQVRHLRVGIGEDHHLPLRVDTGLGADDDRNVHPQHIHLTVQFHTALLGESHVGLGKSGQLVVADPTGHLDVSSGGIVVVPDIAQVTRMS